MLKKFYQHIHWRAAVSFCVSECGIAELITNMALVILPSFSDVQYVLEILVISHKIYVQLNADSAAKNKTYTILHTRYPCQNLSN